MQLLRDDVRCVAVGGDADHLARIGVVAVVAAADLALLPEAVELGGHPRARRRSRPGPRVELGAWRGARPGRRGARTRRRPRAYDARDRPRRRARPPGQPSVLVDADPHGGAVAQHLGVLDEVSGLLAAARLVNAGTLDADVVRPLPPGGGRRFEVLTGLPRPDRWVEARPGVLDAVLERAAEVGDVVVDTGFSLEDDADLGRTLVPQPAHPRRRRGRRRGRRGGLRRADRAGPAGPHPRGAARQHVDAPVTVVVNRMRDSLGWSRRDIVGMVEGYVRAGRRALPARGPAPPPTARWSPGRSVVELGDSPLRRAIAEVARRGVRVAQTGSESPPISR